MNTVNFKSIGFLALIILTAVTLQGCIKTTEQPPVEIGAGVEGAVTDDKMDGTMEGDEKAMEDDDGTEDDMEKEPSMELEEGNWVINAETSVVAWSASRIAAEPHTGRVPVTEGNLKVKEGIFVGGSFTIDMTGITESENNERFLTHVKSDDFFGVETYPTSRFVITDVQDMGDGKLKVTGDLTIRDQTHDISFDAILTGDADVLNAEAHFEIDRTRWGVIFDSSSFFQNLGDKAIKNQITYDLNLSFSPE